MNACEYRPVQIDLNSRAGRYIGGGVWKFAMVRAF